MIDDYQALMQVLDKRTEEWATAKADADRLAYYLRIYVHAHENGNSVPPHLDADARAALASTEAVVHTDGR